ncbi:hypothetical protein [Psychrilyobacter atlanticus]|uniref:hypothetical protein n=1 Tax=Psychrilyobacter atlanticus TaxID=271091 RepID=UPI0004073800|nr:hypothetical protein [Psychrilyobacter atlanticus]
MSLFGIKEKEKLAELNIIIDNLEKSVERMKSQKEKLANAIQEKNIIIEGFKTKEIKYSGEIQKLISKNQELENKVGDIKNNDSFLSYLDILHIGLKLKTQTGRPFEIVSIYDELKIRNSKGNTYPVVKKVLENYISDKDFYNSKGHYSYEPSIAKYIVEKLKKVEFQPK